MIDAQISNFQRMLGTFCLPLNGDCKFLHKKKATVSGSLLFNLALNAF